MIFLQMAAAILLLPLSLIMVLLANIYIINSLYFVFLALFAIVYAALFALLFKSMILWGIVLLLLFLIYLPRMYCLSHRIQRTPGPYPIVFGTMRNKHSNYSISIWFSLSFLKWLARLPECFSRAIMAKSRLELDFYELMHLIMANCRGCNMVIRDHAIELYFEIT